MTVEGKAYYQSLLEKYLTGAASVEEQQELFQELDRGEDDSEWEQWIRNISLAAGRDPAYDRERWEPVLARVLERGKAKETSAVSWIVRWRRPIAAGVIVLLIAGGGYYRFTRTPRSQPSVAIQQSIHDAAPGGNKAILTLSGGRQIILDSAANGDLGQQGNADIRKLSNGKLAYQSVGEKQAALVFNNLATPKGGQYQLTLPDGTQVWLNAASSITYPTAFTGSDRSVTITGEAYLEVAKNVTRPFRVTVGSSEITVLGTSFNINAYPDEQTVKTTLLEGRVKVSRGITTQLLQPGEQASLTAQGDMRVQKNVNIADVVAWKNGFFSFTHDDLETVMRQLSRWYDVDVVYEGTIPPRQFYGKMERDLNLSEVLSILKQANVHFTIEGKQLIVKP